MEYDAGPPDRLSVSQATSEPPPKNRRKKPARPQDWSEAELGRLKAMVRKKIGAREIAIALDRHVGSVKRKLRELRLMPRKR